MPYPIQWFLSLIFVVQMYLAMIVLALVFAPFAMISRAYAYAACRTYCRWVRFSARWLVGLRSEIRGDIPTDEVLIASKHQSFFDIIMIVSVVPRPKFIMKKQLTLTRSLAITPSGSAVSRWIVVSAGRRSKRWSRM